MRIDTTLEQGLRYLQNAEPVLKNLLGERQDIIGGLLEQFINEIEQFNSAYGLVSVQNRHELIVKHVLDSLAPLAIIAKRSPASIADVGSGAGFPGIPLSICLPHCHVTLVERSGRRVGFLQSTVAVLRLDTVTIEPGQMEEQAPGRFDMVTFRAFHPLDPALLKALFKLLRPGGVLAAYKGRYDKIEAEMASVEHCTGGWDALPVRVPFLEEERHIVVISPR
jgi:16S rRNA (guanine527-N7)-methyltransferase